MIKSRAKQGRLCQAPGAGHQHAIPSGGKRRARLFDDEETTTTLTTTARRSGSFLPPPGWYHLALVLISGFLGTGSPGIPGSVGGRGENRGCSKQPG